jgi:hypothetical protein
MMRAFVSVLVAIAVLATASATQARPGESKRIGKAGAWGETRLCAADAGRLYSVDNTGVLSVTDLRRGVSRKLGKERHAGARALWAGGGVVVMLDDEGSLHRIDPAGKPRRVGEPGAWKQVVHGALLEGALFTVHGDGQLYVTELKEGKVKELGAGDYATRLMAAGAQRFYTIEKDGSLFAIKKDGTWRPVGKPGEYKQTRLMTALDARVYTLEASGKLFVVDPATGDWAELGSGGHGQARFLTATGGSLYAIGEDGTLVAIQTR